METQHAPQVGLRSPTPFKLNPLKLTGALKEFGDGILCYVIARRYRGKGPVKLILHRAIASGKDSFGYGAFGCWTVGPGSLLACCRSKEKAAASVLNGRKGGRPRKRGGAPSGAAALLAWGCGGNSPHDIPATPS